MVCDNVIISGKAQITNNANIYNSAIVTDNSFICDNAKIGGIVMIGGNSVICNDGFIACQRDVLWTSPFGSNNDTITAFRCIDGRIYVYIPFSSGYLEKVEHYINEIKSPDNNIYKLMLEFIKANFGL